MKTKITYTLSLFVVLLISAYNGKAQKKLIHFWDFNQTLPLGGSGGDSLGTIGNPIQPSFTTLSLATPGIVYVRTAGDSIVDNGSGGSAYYDYSGSSYTYFTASDSANGNNFIRIRNACKGAYLYIYAPTTGYNSVQFDFAITASSSKGAQYNIFSYSTDAGTTWKNLTTAMDTFNIGGVAMPDTLLAVNTVTANKSTWYPVQMDFSSDPTVNNNPNFVIRFTPAGSNATGTSGNDRYDNFAILGDTAPTGINELTNQNTYTMYPNPATDCVTVSSSYNGAEVATIYNVVGEAINTQEKQGGVFKLNTATLPSGIYFVNIKEEMTGSSYTLKLIKN